MSFYVYIIRSEQDKSYYKGFTEDPLLRLQRHNEGQSAYTRTKAPWVLVYLEVYETKREALIREKALKKYAIGNCFYTSPAYFGIITSGNGF